MSRKPGTYDLITLHHMEEEGGRRMLEQVREHLEVNIINSFGICNSRNLRFLTIVGNTI